MNKDIVEETLNEQEYRMLEKLVYLKLGSGRRRLMNKDIVERLAVAFPRFGPPAKRAGKMIPALNE